MKKRLQGLIVGVLIGVVLTSGAVLATSGTRMAELLYSNIKISLDGKEIVPKDANGNTIEPFAIDGTTYLPVRGIASSLGLNVEWNGETQTVELNKPGIFANGTIVYDDKYVTIEYAGIDKTEYEWMNTVTYHANFNIKNKTEYSLTFQPDAISFDDISYQFSGSEEVAPLSTGKVTFDTDEMLPLSGVRKITGTISVIDWESNGGAFKEYSYDAKFIK